MDPGVLGMEYVAQTLENVGTTNNEPRVKHTQRSEEFLRRLEREEQEFEQDPSKFSEKRRLQCLDKFLVLKISWRNLRYPLLFAISLRFMIEHFTSSSNVVRQHVRKLSWSILTMLLLYRFRAMATINKNPLKAPNALPFIGHLHHAIPYMDDPHGLLLRAAKQVDFQSFELSMPGSNLLVLLDARDREYALRKNWRLFLKNQEDTIVSSDVIAAELLGRGIFSTDNAEWKAHRKIASHMFSANALRQKMERVFKMHSEKFAQALLDLSTRPNPVFDLQDMLTSVVFDGFCEIAFGIDPRAMEQVLTTGTKPDFLVSFDALQAKSVKRFIVPPALWQVARILGVGDEAEIAYHKTIVDEYVMKIVNERMSSKGKSEHEGDLLSLYIDHARENNVELDAWYLRDTIMNFMV
jgi:hypothetical protein